MISISYTWQFNASKGLVLATIGFQLKRLRARLEHFREMESAEALLHDRRYGRGSGTTRMSARCPSVLFRPHFPAVGDSVSLNISISIASWCSLGSPDDSETRPRRKYGRVLSLLLHSISRRNIERTENFCICVAALNHPVLIHVVAYPWYQASFRSSETTGIGIV